MLNSFTRTSSSINPTLWYLRWTHSELMCLKFWRQSWHVYGFAPLCKYPCSLRLCLLENTFEHTEQGNVLTLRWFVNRCLLRLSLVLYSFPQLLCMQQNLLMMNSFIPIISLFIYIVMWKTGLRQYRS